MSAGSGASNLGYGNVAPLSHINGSYVNVDNSQYAGRFGSNEISGTPPGPLPGLAGTKSNIDAAAGIYPGTRSFNGGAKKLKRKIKNITKQYKRMKAGSRKIKSIKRRLRSRAISRKLARSLVGGRRRHSRRHRRQRGGYGQYNSNWPSTGVYATGSVNLPASQLALANPPPITKLSNCVNCVDNYNHYTNMGFPSKGH
jgi:hypothetical protein